MPTYQASSSIGVAPASVWNLLADVTAWPRWLPTVTTVEALDRPSLYVGARFKIFQPKLRPATWLVTHIEPPHRFTWESRSPGLRVVANHVVTEFSASVSHVSLSISFSGALGGIIGFLARSITQSYLDREAAALKHELETNARN